LNNCNSVNVPVITAARYRLLDILSLIRDKKKTVQNTQLW